MRLCLSCSHVSPARAAFCARCGRSFGVRLCKKGHPSPAGAEYCVECGKADLTAPTRYLGLEWLSRLLAWALVLLALRWIIVHPEPPSHIFGWLLMTILNVQPQDVERILLCHLFCLMDHCLVWGLLLALVPGELGRKLRQSILRALQAAWKLSWQVLVWTLNLLHWSFRLLLSIGANSRNKGRI